MSDINPSLVSSELTTIETFKDTTEKRGSKLTLNELNYISDKQLHQKTDGGEGGSSPVGLAKVKFVADDLSMKLKDYFAIYLALPVYYPSHGHFAETSGGYSPDFSIGEWNADIYDGNGFLITPYTLYKKGSGAYTLEGSAKSGSDGNGDYIYITGDCMITLDEREE